MLILLPFLLTTVDELTPIEPAKLVRTEAVDYTKDILPLFAAKCTVCHSGKELKGQYDMGSYAGVVAGGKRKAAVIPGKPLESNLYLYSAHLKKPVMPPASEANDLTPQEVALLKLWIEQGAKGPVVTEVRTRPEVKLALPAALVKPVRALALHPSQPVIAVGRGNRIFLVNSKTGEIAGKLVDESLKEFPHLSLVESLAFSPDGRTLLSGSFREVKMWNVESGKLQARLSGFADKITSLAWSPQGDRFATGGGAPTEDGEIKLYDRTGQLHMDLKSPHSDTVFGLSFSPDGGKLASGGADKFVRVFSVPEGKLLKSFEGHTQHVLDVAWAGEGKRIVSGGADDLIKVWDYEKGERVRDLRNHTKQVQRLVSVGLSPAFVAVDGEGRVRRWSVDSGETSRSYDGAKDALYAVASNTDGSLIATGGEEGVLRIYDGKTGQILKTVRFDP